MAKVHEIWPRNDASTGIFHGIKPIQTMYNNVLFRSRLEARWAVFFTELGIKWDYEFEGYDLHGTWHLPDFYLHDYQGGCYVEVKPGTFSKQENLKVIQLCAMTGCAVFKASGTPDLQFYEVYFPDDTPPYHQYSNFHLNYKRASRERFWVECDPFPYDLKEWASEELIHAVRTAKSYRFTHG